MTKAETSMGEHTRADIAHLISSYSLLIIMEMSLTTKFVILGVADMVQMVIIL